MRRPIYVLAILVCTLLACRGTAGDAPPDRATADTTAADTGVAAAAAAAVTTWRWADHGRGRMHWDERRLIHGPGQVQYELVEEDELVRVTRTDAAGKQGWVREFPVQSVAGGVIALREPLLYVATFPHIDSGCTVEALRVATGESAWSTPLTALGPVEHIKYSNEVQMTLAGDQLVVYGLEIQGRYIEVLDPDTGKTLSNTRPNETLASIPWVWPRGEDTAFYQDPVTLAATDGDAFVFTHTEHPDRDTLQRVAADGTARWSAELKPEFVANASLLLRGDTLYVAHYCSISSGITRMLAFDAASGEQRWSRHPLALGPVEHSEYNNEVELREMHDHVVIFGKESAGNYVEVIDPATGATVSNLRYLD
jgi:PQQ-like domain